MPMASAGLQRHTGALVMTLLLCACHVLSTEVCIDGCVCLARKIICSNVKLSLPVTISDQYTEIEFRQMQFPSRNLARRNLTGLTHLTSLTISASGFETIEPGAFSGFSRLTKLDLSDNNLGRIMPRTFSGLNVDHLFLNRNPRLDLSAQDALAGLRTTGLYLSQCGISDITAETLRPLERGLRILWLDGNSLQTLDPSLELTLRQLRSVKIGDNPLDCSCRMMWFKRLLDQFPPGQSESMFVGGPQQLRCASPAYLAGSFLSQVSSDSMMCRQQSLDLSFTPATGELRCESRAAPQANLFITGPGGQPNFYQAAQGAGDTNVATMIVPGSGASAGAAASSGVYSCTSVSVAGNLSASVNITPPSLQPASVLHSTVGALPVSAAVVPDQQQAGAGGGSAAASQLSSNAADSRVAGTVCPEVVAFAAAGQSSQPTDRPPAKPDADGRPIDILSAKYFSLIDILCATLGTFLATLTVTVLVLHFCVYRRRQGAAAASTSSMGSPPPSDYGTGSVKGYTPSLPAGSVGAVLPMRSIPQTHFVHHKPMYDPDNHYMTTNLEEVEFLHPTCQACTMGRLS